MMEEIFNWVMLGWLLNVGMFIIYVIVLSIKVLTDDVDAYIFNMNMEIYTSRMKKLHQAQVWLSWLIPFYWALQNTILIGYFVLNWKRDATLLIIEGDEIMEHYRIWKRGGFAN